MLRNRQNRGESKLLPHLGTYIGCGHKIQPGRPYTCGTCRRKRRYRERREQGLPYWRARDHSPQGYLRVLEYNRNYRRNNLDKFREYKRKQHARDKELYGGDPSQNWEARFRWLEAREAKREANRKNPYTNLEQKARAKDGSRKKPK